MKDSHLSPMLQAALTFRCSEAALLKALQSLRVHIENKVEVLWRVTIALNAFDILLKTKADKICWLKYEAVAVAGSNVTRR